MKIKTAYLILLLGLGLFSGCSVFQIESQDTTLDFYPPKEPGHAIYLETLVQDSASN